MAKNFTFKMDKWNDGVQIPTHYQGQSYSPACPGSGKKFQYFRG
jgi:hypothetical protein